MSIETSRIYRAEMPALGRIINAVRCEPACGRIMARIDEVNHVLLRRGSVTVQTRYRQHLLWISTRVARSLPTVTPQHAALLGSYAGGSRFLLCWCGSPLSSAQAAYVCVTG